MIKMTDTISCRKENGFTLIETLMAMAIVSIGLLGLAALQTNAITGNVKAQKQSMAILLAENKIEAYKNNMWNTTATAPLASETETGTAVSPWGIFTRTTDIQLDTCPDGTPCDKSNNMRCCGIATIRVRVSWPGRVDSPVDIRTTIAQK
jgi:type IV pilus modification protein PilV